MKKKILYCVLGISLLLNVVFISSLVNRNVHFVDPSRTIYGISNTYELFYDEMETFFESHNDYDAGIIDFEILKEKAKESALNVESIADVLESYNFY